MGFWDKLPKPVRVGLDAGRVFLGLRGWLDSDPLGIALRLLALAAFLGATVSVLDAAWLAFLALLVIALVLVVVAYVTDRHRRPYLRGKVTHSALSHPASHRQGAQMIVEVVNEGRPTPLTDWQAFAIVNGQEYELSLTEGPLITSDEKGNALYYGKDQSITAKTLAPVGDTIVRGFLLGDTDEVGHHDLIAAYTTLEARATDIRGKVHAFPQGKVRRLFQGPKVIPGLEARRGRIEIATDAQGQIQAKPSTFDTEVPPSREDEEVDRET